MNVIKCISPSWTKARERKAAGLEGGTKALKQAAVRCSDALFGVSEYPVRRMPGKMWLIPM